LVGLFTLEGAVMDIPRTASTTQPAMARPENNVAIGSPKTAAPVQTIEAVKPAALVPDTEQLDDALKSINKAIEMQAQGLEFTVDPDSNRTVVKIIDQNTQQVLRQMPSEEALEIARDLDKMQGLLLRQKA
jgi:flagellar protein FlaG